MSTVTVYSTIPNDIELRVYETKEQLNNAMGMRELRSYPVRKFIIKGTNDLYKKNKIFLADVKYNVTHVNKDDWDAYVDSVTSEGKIVEQLLQTKAIFVAKNDNEANAMLLDRKDNIFDFHTEQSFERKRKILSSKARKLV